jgi:hypothetical protein
MSFTCSLVLCIPTPEDSPEGESEGESEGSPEGSPEGLPEISPEDAAEFARQEYVRSIHEIINATPNELEEI